MIKKLLPVILLIFGAGAGAGAGLFLRPPPPEMPEGAEVEAVMDERAKEEEKADKAEASNYEYLKMTNQFVVPIVKEDRVTAMVVLSLSLEVELGNTEAIYAMEPKFRDEFLKVLFDFSNIGGFDGNFTDVTRLEGLAISLLTVAQRAGGDIIKDVLITEIARRDL